MESRIHYLIGDATKPEIEGNKIIVHICNDIGKWGKGFVLSLSKRWETPKAEYLEWYNSGNGFDLANVQFVQTEEDIWVGNMIAQHGVVSKKNPEPPIRYAALHACLSTVGRFAKEHDAVVCMPRIGSGLAGGHWDIIRDLIMNNLITQGVNVFVYDLEK